MRSDTHSPNKPPIAPGRVPLLGHIPALIRGPLPFVQSLAEHGDVVVLYFGQKPAHFIANAELIRQILVTDARRYGKGVEYEKLSALLGNSISTKSGIEHRDRRRLLQPAFHRERVARQAEIMRTATEELIQDWKPGQIIAIDEAMRTLALTIVSRALCSTDPGREMVATIERELPFIVRGVAWRVLLSNKFIENLPLPANRRFASANAQVREVIGKVIERYRAGGIDHGDLLSLLINTHDSETGEALDNGQIQDEVVNILSAGTETTGNGMAWMWHAIAANNQIEQRLHADSISGEMSYIRMLVKESIRLFPPAWIFSRRAQEAVRVGDYDLPVGAQVIFSPYAIQRDTDNYPDALNFDPDRWLPERSSEASRHAFLSFGAGPQNCIGEGFAMLEMMTVASTIASRFRLVPTGPTRVKASATLVPSELRMRVESW